MITINQSAMHVLIDLQPYGPTGGRYTVRKRWELGRDSKSTILPAVIVNEIAFFYGSERGVMLPETAEEHCRWLLSCVRAARTLDKMFESREDFGQKLNGKVMESGKIRLWFNRPRPPQEPEENQDDENWLDM